jgi:hypothetical protein
MSVTLAFTGRPCRVRQLLQTLLFLLLFAVIVILTGCGTGTTKTQTPTTTTTPSPAPPSQPTSPSTPPVPITWSPQSSPLPAPPAQDPPPSASNDFPLTISSPTDGSTATSPVTVVASATPKNPIFFMRVYVDQLAVYFTFTNSINTQLFIAPGAHTLEVMAEDKQGYISATILNITVNSQSKTTISGIQNMAGWLNCSALFPPGSGRDGQICAAGLGEAVTTMTPNQSSPAMDGKSAKFTMGGPTAYSNVLYYNPIAGGNNVSHFIYDLYFYVDNPNAPQALEFDLNQTYSGNRWVWGSECNFNGTGKWDIWDDINGWKPTSVDCKPFPANTWIHLMWNVERVGDQVHYISLTVGAQTYNIDTYYPNQPYWTLEEIDVAFQMDGNYKQEPFNVWLDQVNLTAY